MLVYLYSTIKMMHGPINISLKTRIIFDKHGSFIAAIYVTVQTYMCGGH